VFPPDFSGSSNDDWPTFLARFNAATTVNGYGPVDSLRFLPCCLKDSAFTVFETVRQANPNADFAGICTLLEAHFNPPQQSQLVESEFRARIKLANESQGEFASALKRLATRAFPGQQGGGLYERMLLNQFIDGQTNAEMRLHIRTASPPDLNTAVQRAIELSAIFEVEQRRQGVLPGSVAVAASAIPRGVSTSSSGNQLFGSSNTDPLVLSLLTKICEKLDQLQPPSTPAPAAVGPPAPRGAPRSAPNSAPRQPLKCYFCNLPGHFIRDCPHRARGSGNPQ